MIFDEAHRAAGLKLIPTMAKECRKYGISLVLAHVPSRPGFLSSNSHRSSITHVPQRGRRAVHT